jgi:hypothetical protein
MIQKLGEQRQADQAEALRTALSEVARVEQQVREEVQARLLEVVRGVQEELGQVGGGLQGLQQGVESKQAEMLSKVRALEGMVTACSLNVH